MGGPSTFTGDGEVEDPTARVLLELPEVVSVFMTADFVTITKTATGDWDTIAPEASRILSERFNG